jgi:hypothetical protein
LSSKQLLVSKVSSFLDPYLLLPIGKVNSGCILHPDNEHIIFPLGTTIVVRHIMTRTQRFLRGHDNDISVIIVSSSGKYIASGQKTHMGFQVSSFSLISNSTRA